MSRPRLRSQRTFLDKLVLFLLLLLAVALIWRWIGLPGSGSESAQPRAIAPRGDLADAEISTIELYAASSPSVVHVSCVAERRRGFSMNVFEIPAGTGSGFVWDDQGHVVTNFHVVEPAVRDRSVRVDVNLVDQSVHSARVIGIDPDHDLAVLEVDAPEGILRPLPVGTSADLRVGQSVFAIGNPFGLDHTLTTGVIGGLGREIQSGNGRPISGMVQTDAAINPGNSGGPLLDSAGRLIGVSTAIASPTGANAGIGFAVPVDTVNRIVPQLVAHGKPTRIGLGVQTAADVVAARIGLSGVLVMRVEPGTGAADAGLRSTRYGRNGGVVLGDVIQAVDGEPVRNQADLFRALDGLAEGHESQVTILRDGETKTVAVKLGKLGQ